MEQRYEANRRTGLWLERLVWNVAAGAALAVMILVLLGSIRWLDAIEPETSNGPASVGAAGVAPFEESIGAPLERWTEVAGFNRPSP
ncbi:MAG: hypothetical protein AB8G23_09785 [Myxococcota bacterium]